MERRGIALVALLLLVLPAPGARAGAPDALATLTHEGRAYVELARLAAGLGTTVDAVVAQARVQFRVGRHLVTLTRDWAQILVDGAPRVLDAPVRLHEGAWLVPASFVTDVLPRLTPRPPTLVRPPTLEELRYRAYPSFTRVVLETSAPVTYRLEREGPKEAWIRISGLRAEPRAEEPGDGLIEIFRLERAGEDTRLRVVWVGPPGRISVLTLADPDRLVFDFAPRAVPVPVVAALTPLRTIVLDAGHGGHDAGAVGPGGLMEKDLVLDVTLRVRKLVETRLGLRVLLTREDDTFVPLRDRASFANRQRADLFVSIHANAHRHRANRGVETYFLSSEATDDEARQVAALENGVIQLEKPSGQGGRPDIVRTILWDLAQSEFQQESSRLAEIVQDSMTQALRIPNRGVKQAGFYVLGGAAMPAVLIEIGFVTNPGEERHLKSSSYRDSVARAIFAGLAQYQRYWDRRVEQAARATPAGAGP